MLSALAYYLIVFPLSLLPLRILYLFSSFLTFIFCFVIPYRKKVIEENLKRSFPDKSTTEIKKLRNQFYAHFSDILIEGIKNLSISENELRKRFKVLNPQILTDLYEKNKSVLLVSGHFNNWEWLITAQSFLFPHHAIGIGMPLSNKFWDHKVNQRRARFGMEIIHAKQVHDCFQQQTKPFATLILSDQSPGDSEKAFWMTFLNQETGVLFGCELLAHQYNQAVVYFQVNKIKRGYYEMTLKLITENANSCKWGEITTQHTQLLEKAIIENPPFWMWSHKRWKRKIPSDLPTLKANQRLSFNKRFAYEN
jgi:KDO2-lipid IV(A) lauroyltransferase